MAGKAPNKPLSKNGNGHPFAKQDPKPTRARLVSLLDPLGRKRYREIERFLATINGATSGLHFYDHDWGWTVRYSLSNKHDLCTLHLLPNCFEATIALGPEFNGKTNGDQLSGDLRRRINRTRAEKNTRWVRLPIRSDMDFDHFQAIVRFKVDTLKVAKKEKPAGEAKVQKTGKPAAVKAAAKPRAKVSR